MPEILEPAEAAREGVAVFISLLGTADFLFTVGFPSMTGNFANHGSSSSFTKFIRSSATTLRPGLSRPNSVEAGRGVRRAYAAPMLAREVKLVAKIQAGRVTASSG
jgi:hypothetical protein